MTATDITPLILVTGPTSGLGKDLVLALAHRKVRLLLLGRNEVALGAIAAKARGVGASQVDVAVLDLASFASIRSAVGQVAELVRQGDLGLINAVVANAGIQMGDRLHATADGLETTFGVNVVGNHLLMSLLRPMLAVNGQVVVVGSGTHFGDPLTKLVVAAPRWEDPERLAHPTGSDLHTPKAGQCAYSTSKLGVNYLVHELNRRWGPSIRANVYDPGLMPGTGLARDLPTFKQWAWNHIMPALKVLPGVSSTANSAERLARLTLSEEHPGVTNAYIEIGKLTAASEASNDRGRESALWDYCEHTTNQSNPNESNPNQSSGGVAR